VHVQTYARGRATISRHHPDPAEPRAQAQRRGGTPPRAHARPEAHAGAVEANADAFVNVRLSIINDPKAPPGDRLRAMEQLESRALGKPKETVVNEVEEPEARRLIRELSDEDLEAAIQRTAPPQSPSSN